MMTPSQVMIFRSVFLGISPAILRKIKKKALPIINSSDSEKTKLDKLATFIKAELRKVRQ